MRLIQALLFLALSSYLIRQNSCMNLQLNGNLIFYTTLQTSISLFCTCQLFFNELIRSSSLGCPYFIIKFIQFIIQMTLYCLLLIHYFQLCMVHPLQLESQNLLKIWLLQFNNLHHTLERKFHNQSKTKRIDREDLDLYI